MDEYLRKAIMIASEQFWNSIAGSFPEISNGDMSPMEQSEFEYRMTIAVKSWLKNNS